MKPDVNARIERLLDEVEKPSRYLGGEMNASMKKRKPGDLAFAFCFPDSYEVAMSHLGMKILYDILNRHPHTVCERVFMPWFDMADGLRRESVRLFSLETRTPLCDFDVIGFTLQYEMSFTNILEMLDLGGVAVKSAERGEKDPFVLAGGPCAFNPEPMSAFIDAFLMGDGETSLLEATEIIRAERKKGTAREEILCLLARLEGVYVPRFYHTEYREDGTIKAFYPTREGVSATVRKRIEMDLENAPYPEKMPVPYTQVVHDRVVLEIMRGCTRGCRFCQAGMIYRPVRERSVDRLYGLAEKLIAASGYEEVSLSSLSSGDYPCLEELIHGLMLRFKEKRVGVSLPSMRLDSLVKQSLEETTQVKKSGLTLAPEAGTQRLRDVINKGVTEDDLKRAVTDAFKSGWSAVKLYFMMGLPTETDDDLLGIARVAKTVTDCYFTVPKELRQPGLRVTCSASTFVPKPFTPFQWAAQDTLPEIRRKQELLRQALKLKSVTFNWHEAELSVLEACVARGDRRMGNVIYRAWRRGCRLDSWQEHFKWDEWMAAFRDEGIDPAFYANRERGYDEILPWAFVDIGVTEAFLKRENERAKAAATTPDCRKGCQGCGLRRFEGVCVP